MASKHKSLVNKLVNVLLSFEYDPSLFGPDVLPKSDENEQNSADVDGSSSGNAHEGGSSSGGGQHNMDADVGGACVPAALEADNVENVQVEANDSAPLPPPSASVVDLTIDSGDEE